MKNDKKLNQFQRNLNALNIFVFSLPKKCEKSINVVYCYHYFPRCKTTSDSYKAQTLCRETCQYFIDACIPQLKIINALSLGNSIDITNCTNFPGEILESLQNVFISNRGVMRNGKLHKGRGCCVLCSLNGNAGKKDKQTDKQTDSKQTNRQTDEQTDRQTNKQIS